MNRKESRETIWIDMLRYPRPYSHCVLLTIKPPRRLMFNSQLQPSLALDSVELGESSWNRKCHLWILCFQNVPWPSDVDASDSRLGNKSSTGSTSWHPAVTRLSCSRIRTSHHRTGLTIFCSEGRVVSSCTWSLIYKASGKYKWKTIPYGSNKEKAPCHHCAGLHTGP